MYKYSICKDANDQEYISIVTIYAHVEHLVIPETIKGIPVKCIDVEATQDGSKLISVELPNSITEIKESAFCDCQYLETINFPKNLISIGAAAFTGNKALKGIELNEGLIEIDDSAFSHSGLKSVKIPDSVTHIGSYAFSCTDIATITFGNQLKSIGGYAFKSCKKLETVVFPESLESIEENAFDSCTGLKSVTFNSDIQEASTCDTFFFDCPSLEEINTSLNNKRLISVGGVLYNKEEGSLIRFPPNKKASYIEIPRWVSRACFHSFNGVKGIEKIKILSPSIEEIRSSNLLPCGPTEVECLKDSEIERWAKTVGFQISHINNINTFLSEISNEKDKDIE